MVGLFLFFIFQQINNPLFAQNQETPPIFHNFTLTSTQEEEITLSDHKGQYIFLEWINYGCPFVKRHYHQKSLQTLQSEVTQLGHKWFTICSSAPGRQGHFLPSEINLLNKKYGFEGTAYLIDKKGDTARNYQVPVTPFIVIISPDQQIIYKGGVDTSPSPSAPVNIKESPVFQIIQKIKNSTPIKYSEKKAYGCSIKL